MPASHTLGPWTSTLVDDPQTKPLVGYRITDAEGTVVAEIFPRPYRVAVNEKNARMIAALPDMLAALRMAHDVLDRNGDGWDEAPALTAIRAVLEKVEG